MLRGASERSRSGKGANQPGGARDVPGRVDRNRAGSCTIAVAAARRGRGKEESKRSLWFEWRSIR